MQDTANNFCAVLFDVLAAKGVRNVVCSPGSRNTPLLLAAAARPFIKKFFVADERSAAFMALGMAMAKQEPVALVCTSGTALLNYAPAVAEAYYQGIPLIVISADRPIQWIDQDDSQTLRQDNALRNFVKQSFSIPAFNGVNEELSWFVNRLANEAVLSSCDKKPGPVHINIHISDPLGDKCEAKSSLPRIFSTITGDAIANKVVINNLALTLANKRVMLVAGFMLPDSFVQRSIADFSRLPNVTVMAETISNLHLDKEACCVDSVLTAFPTEYLDELAPDIVISLGGALVSRKLKEYLRRNKHKIQHWAVGYSNSVADPFMSLNLKIEVGPARFFRNLNSAMKKQLKIRKGQENFCSPRDNKTREVEKFHYLWSELKQKASLLKESFIESCNWSELKIFQILLKNLPSDYNLFLSNGTVVRYAQLIKYSLPHASYCNRGVSGIDGTLSTAFGGAIAYKGNTLLISGDLSFSYDINALGLAKIPNNVKIVVIDNQGGGIFRFIPSTSSLEEREEYFCQPPELPLKSLADGYGWEFFEVNDEMSLKETLPNFFTTKKRSILKISCNGEESAQIIKNYMDLSYKDII